jgi:hypothetical protein
MRISTIYGAVMVGVVLMLAPGCSNDAELPTAYHQGHLAMPTDVAVVLSGSDVEVTWQIASEENVVAFVVTFTDATGAVETRSVQDATARSLSDSSMNTESGSVIHVRVGAADETDFLGPFSTVVSLIIE